MTQVEKFDGEIILEDNSSIKLNEYIIEFNYLFKPRVFLFKCSPNKYKNLSNSEIFELCINNFNELNNFPNINVYSSISFSEKEEFDNLKYDEIFEIISKGGFNRVFYIKHKIISFSNLDVNEFNFYDYSDDIVQKLKEKINNFKFDGKFIEQLNLIKSKIIFLEPLFDEIKETLLNTIFTFYSTKYKIYDGDILKMGDEFYIFNGFVIDNEIKKWLEFSLNFESFFSNELNLKNELTKFIDINKLDEPFVYVTNLTKKGEPSKRGTTSIKLKYLTKIGNSTTRNSIIKIINNYGK